MESNFHSLEELFEQLGLPSSYKSIKHFLKTHGPLDSSVVLSEAIFWTQYQRNFLHEELLNDADWAEVIDRLNSQIRIP